MSHPTRYTMDTSLTCASMAVAILTGADLFDTMDAFERGDAIVTDGYVWSHVGEWRGDTFYGDGVVGLIPVHMINTMVGYDGNPPIGATVVDNGPMG